MIAALDRSGAIGRGGALPWHLPADLRRFRELTTGHHVIMGRRTHESIGRALPGRTNLVLSRDAAFRAPGCEVMRDLDAALARVRAAGDDEAFVIGGAEVYARALPAADRLYLTRVEAEVGGDVFFPPVEDRAWVERSREEHPADARHAHAFAFTVLDRVIR